MNADIHGTALVNWWLANQRDFLAMVQHIMSTVTKKLHSEFIVYTVQCELAELNIRYKYKIVYKIPL